MEWNQRNLSFCDGADSSSVALSWELFFRIATKWRANWKLNSIQFIICPVQHMERASLFPLRIIILSLKMVLWLRSAHQMVYPKQWSICHAAFRCAYPKKAKKKFAKKFNEKAKSLIIIIAVQNYTNTLINLVWCGWARFRYSHIGSWVGERKSGSNRVDISKVFAELRSNFL